MKYLLDSVIVIDHFNGIGAASRFVQQHAHECSLSVITRAETLTGFDSDTEPLALELLNMFPTLPVTRGISDLAARLRRSEGWKLPDAIQAAIAVKHGLTLATRNTRDFKASEKLQILVPYRI